MSTVKVKRRIRIRRKIRGKIEGTAARPRLSVFRSNKQMYAQVIDDLAGHTLVSASSRDKAFEAGGNKVEQAKKVGELIGKAAVAKGIENVIFDRGGYLYHGRVKALAEAAREAGLKF